MYLFKKMSSASCALPHDNKRFTKYITSGIGGFIFDFEGVLGQTVASLRADLLQNCLCFRDGDGLRVYSVLCHWSHLVQDIGCHLTCTKVSTSYLIFRLIITIFNVFYTAHSPFHVLYYTFFVRVISVHSLKTIHLLCIHFFFFLFCTHYLFISVSFLLWLLLSV